MTMWQITEDTFPRIIADDDFGEPGQFALAELRRCWQAVLGADDNVEGDGPMIRLCRGSADLTDEGYALQTREGELLLHAGGQLGAVFGAYGLLRRVAHCRFAGLGKEGERLPRRRRLAIDLPDAKPIVPLLWYRGIQFYFNDGLDLTLKRVDWMAKNGFNFLTYTPRHEDDVDRTQLHFDEVTGDEVHQSNGKRPSLFTKVWFDRFVLPHVARRGLKLDYNHHNLRSWLRPRKTFAAHPQWFAEIDGERSDSAPQMSVCTTNEEAVAQLIENLRGFLRDNPQVKTVGIVPDDGFGMCQCATCVAADLDPADSKKNTTHHRDPDAHNPSKSRRYALLLNRVAAAVAGEFPDVCVGGAAYVDLQWPPRDPPFADNTTVWLAIFWRDGCRPLIPSPPDAPSAAKLNDFFTDLIAQWRETYGGKLTLYEYPMGMERHRSLPYPMLDVICAEWPALRAAGGMTLQCWGDNHQTYALNLLAYAAVGWCDEVDRNAVMRDYLISTFGLAARAVRPIFEALHNAVAELAASKPGDEAWEMITRCQQLRNAKLSDVDYLPPEKNQGILQPTGESAWYLWQRLKVVKPLQLIARAQQQAPHCAAVAAFGEVVRYWQMAASYFDTIGPGLCPGSNDGGEIKNPGQSPGLTADQIMADMLAHLATIPPGWISPRTPKRWTSAHLAR